MIRPNVLRCTGALAAVLMLGASCTKGSGSPSASSTASHTAAAVTFTTQGGDTWSWTQRLAGTATCDNLSLDDNGDALHSAVQVQGSRFQTTVRLAPGKNDIVAKCDSSGGTSTPLNIDERLTDLPQANIHVAVNSTTVVLDGSKSTPAPDGAQVKSYTWSPDPRHPAHLISADGEVFDHSKGAELRLRAPSADGEYYVQLTVTDAKGRTDRSVTYFEVKNGAPRVVDMMHEHPAWINKAVIYAPIPSLWGGGPKSVTKRLPYLKKLGVDALWLWPPAELRSYGQEYAIDDYYKLDPQWEPASDFKKMVDKAHELGMHVMIDFVPNHMSAASPYFKDTKEKGKASRYWDFFDRKPDGKFTHYFDWTNLPNLNYDNPEVRNMIIGAAEHWVRDYHIDGFRVDAAWGVKKRRPSFWPEFRMALKRINPDLLLLAEASGLDPYYFSHGFDVGYDWTHSLGQWAWGSAFKFPQEAGTLLKSAVNKKYAPDALVMHFLNNNDTGVRFVYQYGAGMTRVAATMEFTLPGVPEMFAGDEIGANYEPYSNLQTISPWKDKFGLMPLYKKLIELRHNMPALTSHDVDYLNSNTDSVLAYVRPAVGSSPPLLVILNYDVKTKVTLSGSALDSFITAGLGTGHDLLTNKTVTLSRGGGGYTVTMPKTTAVVLSPGGD
jgi:cyclomaltodextrinase / maltogenic alpha-amylase / neopullulanase